MMKFLLVFRVIFVIVKLLVMFSPLIVKFLKMAKKSERSKSPKKK